MVYEIRSKGNSIDGVSSLTPTDNEREYVLRTEMHQGGLRQYMDYKVKGHQRKGGSTPYRNGLTRVRTFVKNTKMFTKNSSRT